MTTRRLAAVLFADIVGYTALMQSDESLALSTLEKFKRELDTQIPANQGEIIQFYGDGCLCVFNSSVDAVAAAEKLQIAFQKTPVVPVRIGLNVGDIVFREGNVFGDAVNIASRVESLGISGAVLLSSTVREQVKNQLQFKVKSLGKFDFKNVEKPLEVFALANEGIAIPKKNAIKGKLKTTSSPKTKWLIPTLLTTILGLAALFWFKTTDTKVSPSLTPSIAVLPFRDMSPNKDQAYFGDGIAEEILNSLAQLKAIKVAGRTSSFSFKDQESTIATIGKELQVNHVLEGSVRKYDDKIRVTAQLIKVEDGFHVWSDKYDRSFEDVFKVQDELAQSIGKVLLTKLAPEQRAKLTSTAPKSSAYDLFLKAKHIHKNIYNSSLNVADFLKSEQLFLAAIQLDSTDAAVHAGLADLYDSYWVRIPAMDAAAKEKYLQLMEKESELAIQLNPNLAYANQVRGYILRRMNQTDESFKHFLKGYEISPNNPESIIGLSNLYLDMGLHEDALQLADKTIQIDPLYRQGLTMQIYSNFYLGNLEKTVNLCQSFLDIAPNNITALEYLFRASYLLKDKKQALAAWDNMEKIDADATKRLGLELENALLRNNSTYVDIILKEENQNAKFNIYSFQGEVEKAEKAFQLATEEFLNYADSEAIPQGSIYLDLLKDRKLEQYQSKDWFQQALSTEKKKYDYLFNKYPRAKEILN